MANAACDIELVGQMPGKRSEAGVLFECVWIRDGDCDIIRGLSAKIAQLAENEIIYVLIGVEATDNPLERFTACARHPELLDELVRVDSVSLARAAPPAKQRKILGEV